MVRFNARSLKNRASWTAQDLTRPGQCHHNWIEGTGARLRRSTEQNWAQRSPTERGQRGIVQAADGSLWKRSRRSQSWPFPR